jgi:hypothetical protein
MVLPQLTLYFRFFLELAAFVAAGAWAYGQAEGLLGGTLALVIPLVMALVWGIFSAPNDPSRAGKPPVAVPGWLRLLIEVFFFGFAIWCVFALGLQMWGWLLAAAVLLLYGLTIQRVRWLLRG